MPITIDAYEPTPTLRERKPEELTSADSVGNPCPVYVEPGDWWLLPNGDMMICSGDWNGTAVLRFTGETRAVAGDHVTGQTKNADPA